MAEETGDGILTTGELERALREVSAERDSLRSKLRDVMPLVEALEVAETFVESVTSWTGSDPDERDETLTSLRAALAPFETGDGS